MPRTLLCCAIALVTACGSSRPADTSQPGVDDPDATDEEGRVAAKPIVYPVTRVDQTVDVYHGTKVADPYRWLEDDDSPETAAWVKAQNAVTFAFLESIPQRKAIGERLTSLWNYEKYGAPSRVADRYFYSKNDGLQNQNVIYWTASLDGEPKVLLDPNTMSKDGTVALAGLSISEDARMVAYGLQSAGSDWVTWHVRQIDTGKDFPDLLEWVKFSGAAWTHDGKGLFYSRYPAPKQGEALTDTNLNQKLYYHRLGTPQADDELVHQRPDQPKWGFGGTVTEDGRYLVVSVWKGTGPRNLILYQELGRGGARGSKRKMTILVGEFDAKLDLIGNDGPVFWFVTDLDAPRGRIVAIDTRRPQRKHWKELVPQGPDSLQGASTVGGKIFADYLHDAQSRIAMYDPRGKHLGDVALPAVGSAGGFGGRRDHKETFYAFTSFTTPGAVYRYDLATGKSSVFRAPKVDFVGEQYETRQVFYRSADGTRIPMFVTHKKGMKLDGDNPTLLYGYGGFNIPLTPAFSVENAVWLEMGGVLAIPNLRGGGEYGEEWHQAGTKLKKQNVFDDFIAAAEWLIANRYTSSRRLAIHGGSNGGLLVGACMTQRPELFGAAMPAVGVMDMLRFHKFTIGWAWIDDYGSSEDPAEFAALRKYSPLHNLRAGVKYPPTLITTGDHDDRVVPAHSFKFAAALQAAHQGDSPVLIRIETRAGHGAGKPTTMKIAEETDQLAFLTRVFGM